MLLVLLLLLLLTNAFEQYLDENVILLQIGKTFQIFALPVLVYSFNFDLIHVILFNIVGLLSFVLQLFSVAQYCKREKRESYGEICVMLEYKKSS